MFRKPTIASQLRGFTDYHSHIMYGVDDGVKTIDLSLQILQRYEGIGIAEVWCTPHIMEDTPNSTDALLNRFAELKAAYTGSVILHLGAEYMMDGIFSERLEKNDLLPLGVEKKQLLVETSYFTPPMNLEDTLENIKSKGYFPVLAHPERYFYMTKDYYQHLKKLNILFQLNLSSLAGAYGDTVQKKAFWLLRKNYYDIAGSDLHSLHNLDFWNYRIKLSYIKNSSLN